MKEITKEDFKKEVFDYTTTKEWKFKGEKPAILDFWAPWCGPCKMVGPILEQLEKEYDGKFDLLKINTDKEQELAQTFGISSIPTLFFVPLEGNPQTVMGALPKKNLDKVIKEVLKV